MKCLAATILIVACAAGCSNTPVRVESKALAQQPYSSADRLIIAAVDNDSAPFLARAGSTPRGYDSIGAYGPSAPARRVMRSLEDDYGLREVSAWPIEPLHMHCAVLEAPAGADRAALLAMLSHDQRIRLAQPMQTFATRTREYNDPYVGLQRGFQQMDVAGAHFWSQGEGIKIALIDTGVDVQHKDLRGRIAVAANFVDADTEQFQRDRHGTEMAGVIAAVANNREGIVGIAPQARIDVFKACWQLRAGDDAARCNSFTLAQALVAAFDAHVQVVNLSLAGPQDPLLRDLIREGLRRGIVFVGAAAADSFSHDAGIIEVASAGSRAPHESAVYAPGSEILTLMPGGHYDFATGDSIATAQITGVVSLLLSKNRGLSPAAVYDLLHNSSARAGTETKDVDSVDACAAVIALVGRGSCNQDADTGHRLAGEQDRLVIY